MNEIVQNQQAFGSQLSTDSELIEVLDVGFEAMEGVYGWVVQALSIILFVIVFNFFIKALLIKLYHRFESKHQNWKASFVKALYRPLSAYVWVIAITYTLDILSHQLWDVPLWINPHQVFIISAILAFTWFLLGWNHNVVRFMVIKSKRHQLVMDQNKVDIIGKLITVCILFVSVLMIMEATHSSMQTLIAFGGIGGLALAFASQEIIANFFGGLMIYFTHPFAIGDWIKLPERDLEGDVEEIGWYMTLVRSFDKRPIYVPNSTFSKVIVINPSRMTHRQIKETLRIRQNDRPALQKIMTEMKEVLDQHPDIDKNMLSMVHFSGYGSFSLDISISTYTQIIDNNDFATIKEDILLKLGDIILANGADFSSPSTIIDIPSGIILK
jgi:MscS family membrane protein